jgi:transposase
LVHRVSRAEGIESHGPDPTSIAASHRRRISPARKALTNERIRRVNRVKGLHACRDVAPGASRLEEFKTGDGCSLSPHRQAQIAGEFVRIELLLAQIKEEADEARDTMLAAAETVTPTPASGST